LVDRWMPDAASDVAYKELCHHMLKLTGVDVEKQWNKYH
jgi:hypothetical protein